MTDIASWRIGGSYYEACNCQAICPCRRQNGREGGLSTYGICQFLLSWKIDSGHADAVDLSDRLVAIAGYYDDNVDGSPWTIILYLDRNCDDAQFQALREIMLGRAGGNIYFTSNFGDVLEVRKAQIKLDHTLEHESIEIVEFASAEVASPVRFDGTVTCGIPGHDRPGQESVSNLTANDGSLQWSLRERCGFATDFAYFKE